MSNVQNVLAVQGLNVWYPTHRSGEKYVYAVNDFAMSAARGEAMGIVGESGSGKSTVAKAIMRLVEPRSGSIRVEGVELAGVPYRELRRLRTRAQIVFQDPYSAFNPKRRISWLVAEGLSIQRKMKGNAERDRAAELLELVGLGAQFLDRFPHQLSGGQRQRVAIARALALEPQLLVLDEPTSALDVSVQAQILNLLLSLQLEFDLTYVLVSHDMAVIRHLCHKVIVMRRGNIVERGPVQEILTNPRHEYTQELLSSEPRLK